MTNDFDDIDQAAKTLRAVRDTLSLRAGALNDDIEVAKRKAMRGLRASVAAVTEAQSGLLATISASPQLFTKPRSIVLHGIKLGFVKGKGRIEWEDDAQVVKLVRKHLPEQFDVLVKTTETPVKAALNGLTVAELKRIGVSAEDSGDVAFAKDTTAEVDKLVKALLKGAEEEAAS